MLAIFISDSISLKAVELLNLIRGRP